MPGGWVAGDVADINGIVTSIAGGSVAAAAINADLIAEDTQQAVNAYRNRHGEPVSALAQ